MKPHKLQYAEFHITNVCNFNCPGCNKFSNYAFSGSHTWKEYGPVYQRWAQVLDLGGWTLLGGEPMAQPDHVDWIRGLGELWPNAQGGICTNGHYLTPQSQDLYQALKDLQGRVWLEIGLHNKQRSEQMIAVVLDWLQGNVEITRTPEDIKQLPNFDINWRDSYNKIRDPSWPDCETVDEWNNLPLRIREECEVQHQFSPRILADVMRHYIMVDSNGVKVKISPQSFFHQGPLIRMGNQFRLHTSDVDKAHTNCYNKTCHHFNRGMLHKCGMVAMFKEFEQQYDIALDPWEKQLIHDYKPAHPDNMEHLERFISEINDPIPQCRFCPENYHVQEIHAQHGNKPKVIKLTRKLMHGTK